MKLNEQEDPALVETERIQEESGKSRLTREMMLFKDTVENPLHPRGRDAGTLGTRCHSLYAWGGLLPRTTAKRTATGGGCRDERLNGQAAQPS